VTATRSEAARAGLLGQLGRFVAVGVLCALVDFGIYHALVGLGLWVHAAKAVSFICGTTTAYFLNRRFTFDAAGGRARLAGFMLLYGTTFALNVGMNALMLAVLPEQTPLRLSLAWVIAQGTATAVNFVLLRTVVFRSRS
jgi:putative flippase GtrA